MLRIPLPWETCGVTRQHGEQHLEERPTLDPGANRELTLPEDLEVEYDDGKVDRRTVIDRVAQRIVRESRKPQYIRRVSHEEARVTARRIRLRKEQQGRD